MRARLTQRELAVMLGVTKRAIENWEAHEGSVNHRTMPQVKVLALITIEQERAYK